jgi:hypothetical protein
LAHQHYLLASVKKGKVDDAVGADGGQAEERAEPEQVTWRARDQVSAVMPQHAVHPGPRERITRNDDTAHRRAVHPHAQPGPFPRDHCARYDTALLKRSAHFYLAGTVTEWTTPISIDGMGHG